MRFGGPEEAGEGMVELFFGHADAGVGDFAAKLMPGSADFDGDRPAMVRVFDGVGDEVVDGLTQAVRVEMPRGGTVCNEVQPDASRPGLPVLFHARTPRVTGRQTHRVTGLQTGCSDN